MIAPQNLDLKKLYKEALTYQNKLDFEAALSIYSEILKHKPNSAEVHYQVGLVMYFGNRFLKSVFHLNIANQIKPNVPEICKALVKSLVLSMDKDIIQDGFKNLKESKLPTELKSQLQNQLVNLSDGNNVIAEKGALKELEKLAELNKSKRLEAALEMAQTVEKRFPNSAAILDLCGEAYVNTQRFRDAEKVLRKATEIDPTYWRAHYSSGLCQLELGATYMAYESFRNALYYAPRNVDSAIELGNLILRQNKIEAGTEFFSKCLNVFPKKSLAPIQLQYGARLIENDKVEKGTKICRTAIANGCNKAVHFTIVASAYLKNENYTEAQSHFDTALKLEPNYISALVGRASLNGQLGKFDAANNDYLKVMQTSPRNVGVILSYMRSKKGSEEPELVKQMIELYEDPLNETSKIDLGFAIAKGLEDQSRYDEAIKYLDEANSLEFNNHPFEIKMIEQQDSEFADIVEGFDLNHFKGAGFAKARPIFVTGMPRSGTTLTEQIISAHPLVTAAGEIGNSSHSAFKRVTVRKNHRTTLRRIRGIPAKEIFSLGKECWNELKEHREDSEYITDKAIGTYQLAGLIQAAMPNGKFVILRRDPRDNLLSIYKNRFMSGTHKYANNLEMLGHQYNAFVRRINFWKSVMPEHIYEVHYEKLTANPEEETRKLIDYCGLPWDDACLSPHKSKRAVKTLSIHQVRQPIYTSSVKSWQRYEAHLQPMFDVLKEAGNYPEDD
ncbi:MAG: sulfotransferase [Pseudomonadota bacterium]